MGVVYNPDRNTLIPISTVSGEITYLTADLIYEKMQTCLIIGTEVTYLKHYPDQDIYLADKSYTGVNYNCIFSNRAQRDPYSYFHRWNPNTQEFVIRAGVSLNLSNVTKNGIMYFYFPNDNAYTILAYDYNRLFFNNVEEIKATVRVNYYLPDYDYTYAKITYKQDSEPASETDGTSVNILKDETSVNIEGLEEEKTYYFKIFTDKSESEAFQYTVEVDPVPPEYKQYIDYINGSGFNFKNYPIIYGDRIAQPIVPTIIENMSWVVGKNYARWDKIYPSTPITVKLTGDTTHITITYEGYSNSEYTKCNDYYRIMYNDKSYDSQNPEDVLIADNVYTAYYGMNYYSVGNFTTEFAINNADNIQQALIFFTTRFKNIIIYVNNELWSNPF